jgi:hypothetical protein
MRSWSGTAIARIAPEMLVEFLGLRRHGKGRKAYNAIRLGRVLKIKTLDNGYSLLVSGEL